MGRYTGPKCRLCRREGVKLFLRGPRCETTKCALSRRDYPPGMQSKRRGRVSDYGVQLREKQKVKRYYGVLERQFRRIFAEALRLPGNTGEHLLILLERRLDNAVTRAGLAVSHAQARQFIVHGHVFVNGRRVDRPSYPVKPGDVISIREKENSQKLTRERLETTKGAQRPAWIAFEDGPPRARIVALPTRDEVTLPVQEQLIVEFCSK